MPKKPHPGSPMPKCLRAGGGARETQSIVRWPSERQIRQKGGAVHWDWKWLRRWQAKQISWLGPDLEAEGFEGEGRIPAPPEDPLEPSRCSNLRLLEKFWDKEAPALLKPPAG